MTAVLVDSNVILDIVTRDPTWAEWSRETLVELADGAVLTINPIIYAEVSIGFERIEDVERALPTSSFVRAPIPPEAAFLAGKAFLTYRRRGGVRATPLPDFFIGAHASIMSWPLVTRDRGRYATYFPRLQLVAPSRGA